ncbi:MAG: UTP--glucose-1-phosphate uridylyltransferase [Deltaproteobacteria bacterium]|nr:UTP--glucose-1-phosphate uridylyltransferase [Deltaproteobacteria bacterium]
MNLTKVVIPAAGRGTRLLPATKAVQKELIPIIDKPTVEYAVEEALKSDFKEVLFITSDKEGSIKNYFLEDKNLNHYLEEKKKYDLLEELPQYHQSLRFHSAHQPEAGGLGAAVLLAEDFVQNEAFTVTLVDDIIDADVPVLKQIKNVFSKTRSSIISVMEVSDIEVPMYGIVEGEEVEPGLYKIKRVVEKPKASETTSRLAIIGRYLLTPGIFECLKITPRGKSNEIQLTDAISLLLQKEEIYAYKFKGTRIDAGDKLGLLKAQLYFGAKNRLWKAELKKYVDFLFSS